MSEKSMTDPNAAGMSEARPFWQATREISDDEAKEIAGRLINSHFGNANGARVSIPARPDHDDDLLILSYIEQVRRLRAALDAATAEAARLREALAVRTWTEEEAEGMSDAYRRAGLKHGHYETLFAVGAWLLRHRLSRAGTALAPTRTEATTPPSAGASDSYEYRWRLKADGPAATWLSGRAPYEVSLQPGWLHRDTDKAKERVAEWTHHPSGGVSEEASAWANSIAMAVYRIAIAVEMKCPVEMHTARVNELAALITQLVGRGRA